jgi:hypothetical protein
MTVAIVIVSPWAEKDAINAELIERGHGPCLSVPMVGDRKAEEGETPSHVACHWWIADHEPTLETLAELRDTLFANSNIVVRGDAENVPEELGAVEGDFSDVTGTWNAMLGDSIVIRHKQFGAQWGWRAEMNVQSGDFEPGVRAVAIYSDANHQNYLYTTGAFTWDAAAQRFATEWNPGHSAKQDIHWAVLYASLQEQKGTLQADADADALFLKYGLPTQPEPEPEPDECPAWKAWDGHNTSLYQVGDCVTYNGQEWISTTPNNHWQPGVYGWVLK